MKFSIIIFFLRVHALRHYEFGTISDFDWCGREIDFGFLKRELLTFSR